MSDQMRDDQLLSLLARALDAADPVPDAVLDAAKGAYTWRTIDAELAALVFDSAAEDLVGVRSEQPTRQLTFSTPGVEIELAVVSETERRIVGQLVPPQEAKIVLHSGDEERSIETDSLGRFTFDDVPAGAIRLTCTPGGGEGAVIQTEWIVI